MHLGDECTLESAMTLTPRQPDYLQQDFGYSSCISEMNYLTFYLLRLGLQLMFNLGKYRTDFS
jgi:hypothetical protein